MRSLDFFQPVNGGAIQHIAHCIETRAVTWAVPGFLHVVPMHDAAEVCANEIKEFTGISAPYEMPEKPELELRTDKLTVAESVAQIVEHLNLRDADTMVSI